MSNLALLQTYTKVCRTCKIDLPATAFAKNNASNDGLQYACKSCDNLRQRKRRIEKKEQLQQYGKEYRKKNFTNLEFRLQGLLNASRARAKAKGREHTLTKQDLLDLYPADNKCLSLVLNSNGTVVVLEKQVQALIELIPTKAIQKTMYRLFRGKQIALKDMLLWKI